MNVFSGRVRQVATAAIVATSTLAFAASAQAQNPVQQAQQQVQSQSPAGINPVGSITITPFVGTGFSGDLDSASLALGVAGGYKWAPRVSFEGEFSIIPSTEILELDSRVWSLTGNVLYHFPGTNFQPYAALGLGFGHGSIDNDQLNLPDTNSSRFILNFGGGVERAIGERLAFRGELRYFFGGNFVPDYWRGIVGISYQLK